MGGRGVAVGDHSDIASADVACLDAASIAPIARRTASATSSGTSLAAAVDVGIVSFGISNATSWALVLAGPVRASDVSSGARGVDSVGPDVAGGRGAMVGASGTTDSGTTGSGATGSGPASTREGPLRSPGSLGANASVGVTATAGRVGGWRSASSSGLTTVRSLRSAAPAAGASTAGTSGATSSDATGVASSGSPGPEGSAASGQRTTKSSSTTVSSAAIPGASVDGAANPPGTSIDGAWTSPGASIDGARIRPGRRSTVARIRPGRRSGPGPAVPPCPGRPSRRARRRADARAMCRPVRSRAPRLPARSRRPTRCGSRPRSRWSASSAGPAARHQPRHRPGRRPSADAQRTGALPCSRTSGALPRSDGG